ncbi:hypothetical protein P0136_04145 [Lentisphaerota bacterium ZTH]|nr:hypothetical protein JYG24_04740 [Lentisphaerota bacterium]WET07187.1 hypothetical protein P0136_04145 [Lentisphaerota bacterium ZTH]
MGETGRYYRHSGEAGLFGLFCIIAGGVTVVALLGALYGFIIHWVPSVYISFFIILGYAVGVGAAIASAGYLGKVRNMQLLIISGVLLGIFAVYLGWVSWIYASPVSNAIIWRSGELFKVIKFLGEQGAWSIFGWTPKGIVLYTVWGIEAALIMAGAVLVPWYVLNNIPFCEYCRKWIRHNVPLKILRLPEKQAALKTAFEAGDFSVLEQLEAVDEHVSHLRVEFAFCPHCCKEYYLTVVAVEVNHECSDKLDEVENYIVRNLIVSEEVFHILSRAAC